MEESQKNLLQKSGKTQAAFVPKLFLMVEEVKQPTAEDPNPTQPLISWSKMGDVFCVFDPIEFSRIILPRHFKHNNWQSFVRQLNMYGFHKVNDLLSAGGGSNPTSEIVQAWEFRHPHFRRGRPDLLPMIKRKSTKHHGSSRNSSSANLNTADSRLNRQKPQESSACRNPQPNLGVQPQHLAQFNRGREAPGLDGRPYWMLYPPSAYPNSIARQTSNRILHAHPPPPPALYTDRKTVSNQPPRPPVLYPLVQPKPHNPASATLPLPRSPTNNHKVALRRSESHPGQSERTSAALYPPRAFGNLKPRQNDVATLQPQRSSMKPTDDNYEPEERRTSDAYSGARSSKCSEETLGTVERELRRLNENLDRKDVLGSQMFNVLGSVVELVTCLVENNNERSRDTHSNGKISGYLHAAQEALGKLETGAQMFSGSNGAPSTDSLSPLSAETNERSNFRFIASPRKLIYPDNSPNPYMEWTRKLHEANSRPSVSILSESVQSLPPLRSLLANNETLISKERATLHSPTRKSHTPEEEVANSGYQKKLPDSINRIMNENQVNPSENSEEDEEEEVEEDDEYQSEDSPGIEGEQEYAEETQKQENEAQSEEDDEEEGVEEEEEEEEDEDEEDEDEVEEDEEDEEYDAAADADEAASFRASSVETNEDGEKQSINILKRTSQDIISESEDSSRPQSERQSASHKKRKTTSSQ